MTDAEIDALVTSGNYTEAAHACAELVEPAAYGNAMIRVFNAAQAAREAQLTSPPATMETTA